jgi:hypothetical protein
LVLGYQVIAWNVATDDWCGADAVSIVQQIKERMRPGAFILLHDRLADVLDTAYFDREPVIEALERLLQECKPHFHFVTVSELIQCGKPRRKVWYSEGNVDFLNRLIRPDRVARRYCPRRP